ncbi:MAG TPA: SRPBCC family protein [Actinophytocola sp.]|uniref:type II toxin-antitoxin system RatA family toxin n=1 Tax=Actinophytocola sp. TaxID=1872138 RepID=UPI002DDD2FD8|nr:SRPBCC family protein [Actinophytocola sp.]HEV2779912.1 SRPBCC family protein [Actinophytocola sp.]
MSVRVPADDAVSALALIADFARFPALAGDVRSVAVHSAPRTSDWVVSFRRGVLRWTESETIDAARLRIHFDQIDGDFAEFHGFWELTPVPGGTEVRFEVTYDFGFDSLAGLLDPIAERVITRVICSVLAGLFDDITVVEGGEALADISVGQG